MASLKDFKIEGPTWALGCEACQYGILAAPAIIGILPVHEQRAVACGEDMILFCDCRAGFMYRQHLRKVAKTIGLQSYKNIRDHMLAATTPTIHAEAQP